MTDLTIDVDPAIGVDITAYVGRTFALDIDLPVVPDPATWRMNVEDNNNTAVLTFASAPGGGITLVAPKTLQIRKDAALMRVATGAYQYDLIQVAPNGENYTIFRGNFILKPSITE